MGASGKKIQKSIAWLMETVKKLFGRINKLEYANINLNIYFSSRFTTKTYRNSYTAWLKANR